VTGKLVFLRTGEVKEQEITDQNIDEAVAWADETGTEILDRLELLDSMDPESVFPKNVGSACQYCAFAGKCNFDCEMSEAVVTNAQAEAVARKIVHLEAQADRLKAILKPWVEKMGPVPAGNTKEFRIDESFWWKFPNGSLQKAVELMQQQGIDPLKVLRLTAEGLKQLPWNEDTLLSLGAQKQTSRRFVLGTRR
jgi:hypothetical protein